MTPWSEVQPGQVVFDAWHPGQLDVVLSVAERVTGRLRVRMLSLDTESEWTLVVDGDKHVGVL